jgi:hypothetical protein
MTDTDQATPAVDQNDSQAAQSGAEASSAVHSSSGHLSDSDWILGDTISNHAPTDTAEAHLPADSHLVLDAATFSDAPANLDHALHQLTTATDLFDVPVLDFDGHHS